MSAETLQLMPAGSFTLRRAIKFRIDGKVHSGELVIGDLRKVRTKGKANAFACSWVLSRTDPKPRDIYGEDALSALLNCLSFLSLYIQNQAKAGVEIWWLERGDNAGLKLIMTKV